MIDKDKLIEWLEEKMQKEEARKEKLNPFAYSCVSSRIYAKEEILKEIKSGKFNKAESFEDME